MGELRASGASPPRSDRALESAGAGVWAWNPATGEASWSDPVWTLLGLDPLRGPPSYQAWRAAIDPRDLPRVDQTLEAAQRGEGPFLAEWRVARGDGAPRWLLARGQRRPGSGGGFEGLLLDVTSPERTEGVARAEALDRTIRENEERYRSVVSAMAEGVVLLDAGGAITMANAAAMAMAGLSEAQLQGRGAADPGWRTVHADGTPFPAEEHPAMVALRTGQPLRDVAMGAYRPDGTLRWLNVNAEPIQGPQGRPRAVVVTFSDVTARTLAEAAHLVSESRFRALIERSSDFTMILDARGTITFASPASLEALGIPPSGLEGTSAFEAIHPDDLPRVEEAFAAILADPAVRRRLVFRIRRSSGQTTLLEAEPRNLLDVPGVEGVVVNSRNVDETQRLREQLEQAQRLDTVGQLAGGVAHDFNNLLGVILGYAGSALRELDAASPLREDLAEIAAAAQRAATLTRQLLAFGRRQVLQPVVHGPNDVVRNLEKMLRRLISEDMALEVSLAEDAGEVLADPSQVEQVVMNLVVNARDALSAGGTLAISTAAVEVDAARAPLGAAPGRYLVLTVRDTGCGMDEATLKRIYEPFFTTKPPGHGTGLGLATVYGIVRQSGGFLEVESAPGRGTRFQVFLPRAASSPGRRPPPLPEAELPRGLVGTVLLVEDDAALRGYCERTLARAGYRVLTAAAAPQALQAAADHAGAIDLVVTDVVMPGPAGPELAAALQGARPGLKVLFISGHVDRAVSPEDLAGPGRSFLAKPFGPADLLERVRSMLAGANLC